MEVIFSPSNLQEFDLLDQNLINFNSEDEIIIFPEDTDNI